MCLLKLNFLSKYIIMLKIKYNENYQLFYLKKAIGELLNEKNKNNIKSIKEDHLNGCNYINNIKIPLTFPLYILNYTNSLIKEKDIDYNFTGTITPIRKWIQKYNKNSVINHSNYGRDKKNKYEIDKDYYNTISRSKFTLTPTGDCPWSYRFFEAIMCLSGEYSCDTHSQKSFKRESGTPEINSIP